MAISNTELRRQMFGAKDAPAKSGPVRRNAGARKPDMTPPRPAGRHGWLASWAVADAPAQQEAQPFAARDKSDALTFMRKAAQGQGRQAFADAGKGLAIILVIMETIFRAVEPAPAGFGWLATLANFIHPFAFPAFFLFAGLYLKRSSEADWSAYIGRKLNPPALALAGWLMAAAIVAIGTGAGGEGGIVAIMKDIGGRIETVALLLVLPIFLFVWKLMSHWRNGTILALAAAMEILHTNQGGAIWVELMRGLVYFAAGHYLAPNLHTLARYVRDHLGQAGAILATWAAFNALMVSASLPFAAGQQISNLPFASLGLGLAGGAALVMLGELIGATRAREMFAFAGRKWMALYATLPLAVAALAAALKGAGLFATEGQGTAALLSTLIAAFIALAFLEFRPPQQEQASRNF